MEYLWKINDKKEYKLRLTTKRLVALEKTLGGNPLLLFGLEGDKLPSTEQIAAVIHAAIQGDSLMTVDVVYDLIDEWLEDGHKYTDLFGLVTDIYKASGLIEEDKEEEEGEKPRKNAKKA